MDFWTVLLIAGCMAGVLGWTVIPINNCLLWYCDWKDGTDINWAEYIGYAIAGPFAWLFAIFEIIMLYSK